MKVVKDHEAILVTELMQDIQEISEGHGLEESLAKLRHSNRMKKFYTTMMKKFNLQKFKTKMNSTPSLLTHTEAILKGYGIREDDIAKAFATLIRGQLSEKKKRF